jgi:uncharacterized protein (DUF58 family)
MAENASTLLDPRFLRKLEALSLASKRIQAGRTQGARRSPKRGSSVEFADFREYALGDDLRSVDWKAYGRLEKLFLKLFVEEEDLSLHLLLDTSRSMEFGMPMCKADYARRIAAALGYIALSEYDRVSVTGFSTKLGEAMPPLRGRPGVAPFFRFLQNHTQTGGETKFGEALTRYAAQVHNPGIAVVMSDFFDTSYLVGLKALLARRFQIVLIHILDEEEVNPTLGGDLRLVDSESGETREVSVSPYMLSQYQAQLANFCDDLKSMARRYGMDYVRAVTDVPFEDIILKLLRSGGIVR